MSRKCIICEEDITRYEQVIRILHPSEDHPYAHKYCYEIRKIIERMERVEHLVAKLMNEHPKLMDKDSGENFKYQFERPRPL